MFLQKILPGSTIRTLQAVQSEPNVNKDPDRKYKNEEVKFSAGYSCMNI